MNRGNKYGLSSKQYDKMYLEQEGLCAICHKPFSDQTPCIDHCHTTKKVRGIVHRNCNLMIGFAEDDPIKMKYGLEYLIKNQ